MFAKLRSNRIARFVVVGTCNAAISFGLLNLAFYVFDQSKVMSSIISTTCALIFSFYMNRGFVFRDKERRIRHQLPAFIVVTVLGSFVVLNLVYVLSLHLLDGKEYLIIDPINAITGIKLSESFVDINLSTVIGAIAAMFWNYNGYKWFVFKGHVPHVDEKNTETA